MLHVQFVFLLIRRKSVLRNKGDFCLIGCLNHRWPKRNITGGPVRNMRVYVGEIEFET